MGQRRLQDFIGTWELARQINDRLAGQHLTFDGRAVMAATGDGLTYDEAGTLTAANGTPMRAERQYLWQAQDDGAITVRFADGRYFHQIGPGDAPAATHDCPPDTYRVLYRFADWPVWHAIWEVTGPRKDYTMQTTYRRVDG